jgi:CheY-like chemotaxis protein
VLVVDDNEDVLKLIQRFLTPHHYRVVTAQTAQEALALSRQVEPHVITLDLMMPDQDGWDLLHALLNQPETQNTPIVVCSVLKQQEDLALSLGATAFLKKPITEEGLLVVIESLEAT